MGWQAGTGDGAGGRPGSRPGAPRRRELTAAGVRRAGDWDRFPPSADLAAALEAACGTDWSCPGASHGELIGLLARWQALESWAAAGKLGVLRALIGEEDAPWAARVGLPEWSKSLTHEVALALGMSPVTATGLMCDAWELQARLPGIGQRIADGKLTLPKARAVADAFTCLSEEDQILAEELILDRLTAEPQMTYGQLLKEATAAAVLVDPEAATARRQDAERDHARVTMFREDSGAAGLSGRDLPTDQALAANASVAARAQQYKDSGAFPQARMDRLRATAFLDLINEIPADLRIARALATAAPQPDDPGPDDGGPDDHGGGPADDGGPGGPGTGGPGCPCRQCDGSCRPPGHDDEDPADPADPAAGWDGPDDDAHPVDDATGCGPAREGAADDPAGSGHSADESTADEPTADEAAPGGAAPDGQAPAPRLTDLVVPLVTLLGWDQRPGESHGLGPLDPALCRSLAALAAASPHTTLCLTITDDNGIAIGHGCVRPACGNTNKPGSTDPTRITGPPGTALPASLNLTLTVTLLAALTTAPGPPPVGGWLLAPDTGPPGSPGRDGTWTLTLPDGSTRTVKLEPVPTFDCDHSHESHAYQPNDTLRHLVQIRDRTCTMPVCSRHARESDFEHGAP